jgi:Flp pilus assembly protein TadD
MSKSHILEALGRTQDAAVFRTKALDMANAQQLYFYARQLQADKKQEEALALYRSTAKKFPDYWTTHMGLARAYSAQGDFDNAAKEVKLSLMTVPDANNKARLEGYLKKLEARQDINE